MSQTIAEKTYTSEPFRASLQRLIAVAGLVLHIHERLGDRGPAIR